jgi:hypothetical protein
MTEIDGNFTNRRGEKLPFKERIPKGFLSVEAFAQNRRLSIRTVQRMLKSGDLVAKRGRWRWFIKVEEEKA